MEFWTLWLESLQTFLSTLETTLGIGSGFAVLALTLLLRAALLPVSWHCAYRGCLQQKRMKRLQPRLQSLRDRYSNRPQQLAEATMKLYRSEGVRPVDALPLLGALVQAPVLFGMFSLLRQGAASGRFLWITNIARPDFLLAVLAGVTTALLTLANPELSDQARMLLVLAPALVAFVFALKFASAIALYWIASNSFSALQTVVVHSVVNRRIRSGALSL